MSQWSFWQVMQRSHRTQKFDDALVQLEEIRQLGRGDNRPWVLDIDLDVVCDLYDERIAEYKMNPPAADWDGVFIATTK